MRYLLGELSAEETDRFEERYFTDDETFDRLLAVKTDLIDYYLHGQLNESQTRNFENFFLKSPNHRREVALVRSLLNPAKPLAAPPAIVKNERVPLIEKMQRLFGASPAWARLAATAFAALLVLSFAWLMIANQRMRAELNTLHAQQQTAIARERELEQQLTALQSQGSTPTQTPGPTTSLAPNGSPSSPQEPSYSGVFAITLAPGLARSAGAANQAEMPVGTRKIRLQLLLDRDFGYRNYAVALKNASDKTIQTRAGLHRTANSSGNSIAVEFPTDKLDSGEYAAILSGIPNKGQPEEIADYPFRLVRK